MPISTEILESIAVILITIILSYFTLVFGELVPKQIAMRKAESLALGLAGLLSGIAKVFAPLVSFLTVSTNAVLRVIGIDPRAEENNVSEEEVGVSLPCEECETFNGLIFDVLGNIPEDGTNIEIDVENLHVKVTEIRNHQVQTAMVSLVV